MPFAKDSASSSGFWRIGEAAIPPKSSDFAGFDLASPIFSCKIATFHACGIFGERHSFASVLNHRTLRAGVTVYGVG